MKKIVIGIFTIICLIMISGIIFYVGKSTKNSGHFISRHATQFFDYNKISIDSKIKELCIDSFVVVQRGNGVVFKRGGKWKKIKNNYGTTCFAIWYNKKLLTEVCFFKKNYWHINDYNFTVDLFEEEPFAFINIIGPDSNETISYKKFINIKDKVQIKYIDKNKKVYNIDTIISPAGADL